ncbi:MAG: hypothetical protein ACFFG0_50390 [Candidatus Thorarchaeota archaeon]
MLTKHEVECINRYKYEIQEIDEENMKMADAIIKKSSRKTILKKYIKEIEEAAGEQYVSI